MKLVILISASLALLATLHGAAAEKARFDNYRIYSVKIDTTEQLMQLQDLDRHLDGVSIALEEQLFAISCSCVCRKVQCLCLTSRRAIRHSAG